MYSRYEADQVPGLTEVERGRSEALHTVLVATNVTPYLDPPANTPLPLRYAFYLFGDVQGRTVLDLGCGSGENVRPLLARGASVIGIDLSQDLIELARQRLALTDQRDDARLLVGSAYDVPLPDGEVDAILCASLLHHLNIPRAMAEMKRLLKPGGVAIVKEPVRFSKTLAAIRPLFAAKEDISEDEHPLTTEEYATVKEGWIASGERAFRLPMIPLIDKLFSEKTALKFWGLDRGLLSIRPLEHFATVRVLKLQKPA